jgi:hypothetical protein
MRPQLKILVIMGPMLTAGLGPALPASAATAAPVMDTSVFARSGTVQFTPTQDIAPNGGPSGTQQLTITIGTGTADRLDLIGAVWSPHSVNKTLQIHGFDANFGATYTVFATATGTKLGTFTESSAWQDGGIQNNLRVPPGPTTFTSFTNPGSVTVTDSLGGSATIPVTVNLKYS